MRQLSKQQLQSLDGDSWTGHLRLAHFADTGPQIEFEGEATIALHRDSQSRKKRKPITTITAQNNTFDLHTDLRSDGTLVRDPCTLELFASWGEGKLLHQPNDLPVWWEQLRTIYNDGVAHAFVLNGNVRDYVKSGEHYHSLGAFLTAALMPRNDLIIKLDAASGMSFPVPAHQQKLVNLLKTATPPAPKVPAVQALVNGDLRSPAMLLLRDTTVLLDWLLTEPLTIDNKPLRVVVLVEQANLLLHEDEGGKRLESAVLARFLKWAQEHRVGNQHLLLLVTETLTSLHSELRRASARYEAIGVPLPDVEAREQFISWRLNSERDPLPSDLTVRQVAQMTGGLSLLHIEDVLFRAFGVGRLTQAVVTERKQHIIQQEYQDVLAISDPRWGFAAVGGYDYIKERLQKRVIARWQQGSLRVGGILMSGPPGTGKTQMAEALAGEAGVPFVVFRLANILHRYVGDSEARLERVLSAVMSLAPVVMFIDELDQVVQRGEDDGSSGVNNRVFARLLEFMEDPARRGKVLIVAATNYPNRLDKALRSRFDRTVPVLPPVADDRLEIFASQAREFGVEGLPLDADVIERTEGWTGRNVRDFMREVAELVDDGLSPDEALDEAFETYAPALADTHEMTMLALRDVSDWGFVPPVYRQQREQVREDGRRRRNGGGL